MDSIKDVGRQAALAVYNQIGPLGPNVIADAVTLANLREVVKRCDVVEHLADRDTLFAQGERSGARLIQAWAEQQIAALSLSSGANKLLGIKPQPGLCNARDVDGVLCVAPVGHEGDEHRSVVVAGLERRWPVSQPSGAQEPLMPHPDDPDAERKIYGAQPSGEAAKVETPTRKPVFVCPECGPGVAVDEDRCCRHCGHDCTPAVPLAPTPPETEPRPNLGEVLAAANNADWQQVLLNGGPPCFHFDSERGKFCLAAQRWAGHSKLHPFTGLTDIIGSVVYNANRSIILASSPPPEAVETPQIDGVQAHKNLRGLLERGL